MEWAAAGMVEMKDRRDGNRCPADRSKYLTTLRSPGLSASCDLHRMTMVADALAYSARSRFGSLAWREAARRASEARRRGQIKEADLWTKVACVVADVSET